jgi:agmatinase
MNAQSQPFAGCFANGEDAYHSCRIVLVGLPDDSQSSYLRGPAEGPARIRQAYDGRCYNASSESGVDLTGKVADLGDLASLPTWAQTARLYHDTCSSLLRAGKTPFFLGGDHAVTVPILKAYAEANQPVHVIQVDAHPDLYPSLYDNENSHACVAARLLEMPHVASVMQIGLRTENPPQAEMAAKQQERLLQVHARDFFAKPLPEPLHLADGDPVYLSIDLDGFDPAQAPGVSHPVPGGLHPRQVLNFLQQARWRLVGMDVVELNPSRDVRDLTAVLAAKLVIEGMGLAERQARAS